jgi:hypothetical protein
MKDTQIGVECHELSIENLFLPQQTIGGHKNHEKLRKIHKNRVPKGRRRFLYLIDQLNEI